MLYAFSAFTFWVFCDTLNKVAAQSGLSPLHFLIANASGGLVTIAFMFRRQLGTLRQKPRRPFLLVLYSLLFPFSLFTIMLSLASLPLTTFYAIAFLTPLSVSGMAAWLYREPLDRRRVLAISVGFLGVLVAINPLGMVNQPTSWTGLIAATGAMACFVTQSLMLKTLGRTEHQTAILFYPRATNFLAGLITPFFIGVIPSDQLSVLIYPFLCGIIGCFGWLLLAKSSQMAPSSVTAPMHYSQIVTGAIIGYSVWGDIPSWHVVIGSLVIIGAGLYLGLINKTPPTILDEERG